MTSFNKKQFSKLLERAIGDRTATEFSNQSGVSRTYISKFLNKRIDSPPSPEILKKIANVAHNNVTYNDLMKTVGFLKEEGRRVEKVARIILFICSMYKINLKSDSSGNISLVSEDKEYCINNISDLYKVQILKEYRPAGVDYDVIEPV